MSKASDRIVLVISFIISFLAMCLLTGCGTTSTSLPSTLQTSGAGQPLLLTTTTFPDGISGRSYWMVLSATGGSGNISSCAVVSGTLPAGLSWSTGVTANTCVLSTGALNNGVVAGAVGAPGSYSVVVQATDFSSPPKTDQLPYTLVIRNDYSICAGPTATVSACTPANATSATATTAAATTLTFPDAVLNRPYGMSPLSQLVQTDAVLSATADSSPTGHATEFGNAPYTASVTGSTLPAGITATEQAAQGNFVISGTPAVADAAQTYTVMVSVSDSPIIVSGQAQTVVPARTFTKSYSLLVHPQIVMAQSLGASWPDAVNGRSFGSAAAGCTGGACAPAVYSVTAGEGLAPYVWPGATTNLSGVTGLNCPAVASSSLTYTCSSADITAGSNVPGNAAVSFSPTVTVTDTGNTATPAATATTDPQSAFMATLWVDSPLGASLSQNGTPNPANLLQGVVARSYGVINADAGAPTYTAAGGLGERAVGDYAWCVSSGALPVGLGVVSANCAAPTVPGAASLMLTASTMTGPASATPYAFALEVTDAGNGSTPIGTSATGSTNLLVSAALAIADTIYPGGLPPGVVGRDYGVNSDNCAGAAKCAPPVYTASAGLGTYTFAAIATSNAPVAGAFPTGFACTPAPPTDTCDAPPISAGVTAGTFAPGVSVSDGGNAAVPSATVSTAEMLMVDAPLAVSDTGLPGGLPPGVVLRDYGVSTDTCAGAAKCLSPVYTATAGLGTYTFAAIATVDLPVPGGFPAGFMCTAAASTDTCSAMPISPVANPGSYTPSVTASDAANAATPSGTASSSGESLTVDQTLAITDTNYAAAFPNGVVNRDYGVAADTCVGAVSCLPPLYTATQGLGTYTFAPITVAVASAANAFPMGFTCTSTATTDTCFAQPINAGVSTAAAFMPTVSVSDAANTTTPSGTATSTAQSLTLDPALAIADTAYPGGLPPGVVNRDYGVVADNCAGAVKCAPPVYTASNGLGTYTFATITTANAPAGAAFPTGFTCTAAATTDTCSGTIGASVATSPAFTPGVSVSDGANQAAPSGTISSAESLTVDPQITMTLNLGTTWPDAVMGRSYGDPAIACPSGPCTEPTWNIAGGLGTPYHNLAHSGFPGTVSTFSFPTTTTWAYFSTGVNGAPGTYNPNFTVTDTANTATPAATVTSDPGNSLTATLVVDPALAVSYSQIQNPPTVIPNPANLLPGVVNRSYGTINPGATNGAPVYAGSGGLGAGSAGASVYGWCVGSGALPTGLTFTGASVGGCGGPATGVANSVVSSASITGAASTYTFALELNDSGNSTTPSSFSDSTFATSGTASLVIDPALAITDSTYTSPLPAGVVSRDFGSNIDFCGGVTPCAPPVYTASNGLGTYTFSAITTSNTAVAGAFPTGFTCAPNVGPPVLTDTCKAVPIGAAVTAGTFTPSVQVSDTANNATPSANISSAESLTVDAVLAISDTALPGGLPPGVVSRDYGFPGDTCAGAVNCKSPVYTTTNGLGGYSYTAIATSNTVVAGDFPTGFNCTASGSPVIDTCFAMPIGAGVTTGVAFTPSVTASDTANAATPKGSVSSSGETLTVDAVLAITDSNYAGAFPPGVVGRDYGVGGDTCSGALACKGPLYTASAGLGGYSFAAIATGNAVVGNNFPTGFVCMTAATTDTCSAAPVGASVATGTAFMPEVTVSDSANTTTPSGSQASTAQSLNLSPALAIADTAYPGGLPAGVVNRDFGSPADTCAGAAACAPPVYTATNGLGTYTFSAITTSNTAVAGAFPTGFACTTAATTDTCKAVPVGAAVTAGTFTPGVTVSDTANAAAPKGSISSAESLTVDAVLAISDTALPGGLPPGVVSRDYGVSTDTCAGALNCKSPVYTTTNGLGGYTYAAIATSNAVVAGDFPTGFTCAASSSPVIDTCMAAPIGAGVTPGSTFMPSVTASDTPNAATPKGSVSSSGESLVVDPVLAITDSNYAGAFPPGVVGRDYGVGTDTCAGAVLCKPPLYTASNGLGTYTFAAITTGNAVSGNNFPTGFVCMTAATTDTCSAAPINASVSTAAPFMPEVTVSDTANTTTPSGSQPSTAQSLTLDPALAIADSAYPGGLPAAVVNRDFGVSTDTCAGAAACAPPVYTASNGLGTYTFTAITTANAPAGPAFPTGFTCTTAATTDTCKAAPIGASVATSPAFTPGVMVSDTANAAAPKATVSSSESLTVDPQITMTVNLGLTWPDAVDLRAYGTGTGCTGAGTNCTEPTYTIANGLGGYHPVSHNAFPLGNQNFGFATPNWTYFSTGINTAPGNYSPNFVATDTANAATPAATTTTDPGSSVTVSVKVDAALTVQFSQNQPPSGVVANPATLLPGVVNRSYGTINGGSGAPAYTGVGGLGVAAYGWCVGSGALPTGLTFSGASTSCGGPATDTATSTVSSTSITGAANTYTFTLELFDIGNATTPNSVSDGTSGISGSTSLVVNSALAVNVTSPAGVTTELPDAVLNRDYAITTDNCTGTPNTCSALTYAATGGLLNGSNAYASLAANGTNGVSAGASAFPTGFNCSDNGTDTILTCSASPVTSTDGAGSYDPSVTATDTANNAVPSGTAAASPTLNVDSELAFNTGASCSSTGNAVCIGGMSYTSAQAWPVAVTGRPYGAGSGCVGGTCNTVVYTATGGLGTSVFPVGVGYTFPSATVTGFPTNITCTTTSPSLTCATPTTGTTTVTAAAGAFSPSVTALDTANSTTPAATTATDTNSILTSPNDLTVNSEIVILNSFLMNATVNEPYYAELNSGITAGGAACTTQTATDCGGVMPPYTWCTVSSGACASGAGISGVTFGAPATTPFDDTGKNIRGYYFGTPSTAGSDPTVIEVADSGNATTPAACSASITCPTLSLTGTQSPKAFLPDGFVPANSATSYGNGLFGFDTNTYANAFATEPLSLDSGGAPIVARVTPDGNWVYVSEYGTNQVAVVDPLLQIKTLTPSITISNTGTPNPWWLDIEPQQYFATDSGNSGVCAAASNCSNLEPYVRYDAWVADPNTGSAGPGIEPLSDAENPGLISTPLSASNYWTLGGLGLDLGMSVDATQAFVGGTATGAAPPSLNATLALATLPTLSGTANTTYPGTSASYLMMGNNSSARAQGVSVDPRGNYVYSINFDDTNTYSYVGVSTTGNPGPAVIGGVGPNAISNYLPNTAGPANTVNICANDSGTPFSVTVSPEGNRLFVLCFGNTNPDEVDVWDISQTDGSLLSADASSAVMTPVAMLVLPASAGNNGGAGPANSENGCSSPFDIESKLTTTAFGTRIFISCYQSDTVLVLDYATGSGSDTIDSFPGTGPVPSFTVISTDTPPITNASLGNTGTAYTTTACGGGGSCPQSVGIEPNPSLHFVSGGYVPSSPQALPPAMATAPTPYYQYVLAAGGAIFAPANQSASQGRYTWSNPDGLLGVNGAAGTDPNCGGLTISSTSGEITGTPTVPSATCGGATGFTIRVTDASGQFVERVFTIAVN